MHDGVTPGSFSANVLMRTPNEQGQRADMKSQNRRKAPKRARTSFLDWLHKRAAAEEEELEYEELDDNEYDEEDGPCCLDDSDEEEPEEFDDYDKEKPLDFDDDEERAPFPLPGRHDEEDEEDGRAPFPMPGRHDEEGNDDESMLAGRFSDFFRMGSETEEEEEPNAPGGFDPGQAAASAGTVGGMGSDVPKIERARILMRQLVNKPGIDRDAIIQEFMQRLPTTESTAVSYYEDIAREMGLMGKDDAGNLAQGGDMGGDESGPVDELPGDNEQQLSQEEIESQDPNGQGIIRTVNKAHLVFKRQMEDGKFEELWVYNLGDTMNDALSVRREILSGTDIPRGHTRSEDGNQTYTLHTMGNAQLLHVTGLAN